MKMNKTVKIEGLNCANCAKALENEINKLVGVKNAKVNFVNSAIYFESDNIEKATKDIVKLTKEIEPDAKIVDKTIQKTIKIQGLDCANCAKVLETEINKLDCVSCAKVDFVKSAITFESEDLELAQKEIVAVTKQVEPNAKINIDERKKQKFNVQLFVDVAILLMGIIIGICVLTVSMPVWAFWTLYCLSILMLGYRTYIKAFKLLCRGIINENLLITLSVIGATAVGEYMEGIMVVALYSIGKILEGLAVNKSRKSIAELTNLKPDYAVLLKDGKEEKVNPKDVLIGSEIIVKPGEKVALDGVVLDGTATLDTQSLTGESVPVSVKAGDEILSGSIVLDGVLKVKTTSEYENSTVNRIMNLIENASEKKSKTETIISKITRWYTLGVILLAVMVWGIVWAVTKDINVAVYRGLIFLVVSCPCAFAISVPLSYFSGIGNASKKGILIKGSNYLDACAKMNIVAFDKTGTMTTGHFSVEKIEVFSKKYKKEDILFLASVGEQYSLHPLAKAIVNENGRVLQKATNVHEKAGEGVYFSYKKKSYFVGRKDKTIKNTAVEVYEEDEKLGIIYLSDTVKESAIVAAKELSNMNVKTVLLSGDNDESVKDVAHCIGVSEFHSQLLPQDKFAWIEENKKNNKAFIGFVGDGINDAPSLMLADVGISMGIKGSAASIEASDVVLVDDNPQKVATAIKISKFTRKIVWENIILSAGIKIVFLLLGSLGITGMLSAVIADVGVTLLAILNSMRALKYSPKIEKN